MLNSVKEKQWPLFFIISLWLLCAQKRVPKQSRCHTMENLLFSLTFVTCKASPAMEVPIGTSSIEMNGRHTRALSCSWKKTACTFIWNTKMLPWTTEKSYQSNAQARSDRMTVYLDGKESGFHWPSSNSLTLWSKNAVIIGEILRKSVLECFSSADELRVEDMVLGLSCLASVSPTECRCLGFFKVQKFIASLCHSPIALVEREHANKMSFPGTVSITKPCS